MAAGLLDEAVDLRQAEAGAFADPLGGEERLEGLADDLRRHPRAAIADEDADILPGRDLCFAGVGLVEEDIRRLDRELATIGHRVARVDGEVEQRALELGRVDEGRPKSAGEHVLDDDGLAQGPAQHIRHAGDEAVDGKRLRRERLAARESEEAMDQKRAALGAPLGRACETLEHRLVALGETAPQRLDIARDDREQIVEIMRDAAGELADRLHLLRLAHPLLAGPALGQVAGDLGEADEAAAVVADGGDDDVGPEARAVLAQRASPPTRICRHSAASARARAGTPAVRSGSV